MNKIVEYFKNNKLALKSKVCHDLDKTPYIYCIGDIIYKFSSAKKREKQKHCLLHSTHFSDDNNIWLCTRIDRRS